AGGNGSARERTGAQLQILNRAQVLENVLSLRNIAQAHSNYLVRPAPGDVGAAKQYAACPRHDQADHRFHQGRFPGAARPDDGDDLAVRNRDRNSVQNVDFRTVTRHDVAHLQHGRPGRQNARLVAHADVRPRYASITRGSARTTSGVPSAITAPSAMTTTRSARVITTSMSCSTNRNVMPCDRRSSST